MQRNRLFSDVPNPCAVVPIPIKVVPIHHKLLRAPCNWFPCMGFEIPCVAIRVGDKLRPLVGGGRRGPLVNPPYSFSLVRCCPLRPLPITISVKQISIPQQHLPKMVLILERHSVQLRRNNIQCPYFRIVHSKVMNCLLPEPRR